MIKKLLPVVMLLIGTGAGVGAGIFLRPAEDDVTAHEAPEDAKTETHAAAPKKAEGDAEHSEAAPEKDYIKMSNQFVIPIVQADKVTALVVMSLSLEVPFGQKEHVFAYEPKLRDSFLQVLFDHANIGGFAGAFTDAGNLKILRRALLEVAQRDMGEDVVQDVLITEIARQDY